MAAYDLPPTLSRGERITFKLPVIGRIAKEVSYGSDDNIFYAIGAFVSLWGCSAMLFGLPGLYIPAVLMVPVMFVLLILISRG